MHRAAAARLLALTLFLSAFGAALPAGAQAAEPATVLRVSGASRIETAAKLAATAYPDGATTVNPGTYVPRARRTAFSPTKAAPAARAIARHVAVGRRVM